MTSTSSRVFKNTIYLYAKMAATIFVTFFSTRLIINSLGFEDYGIYNVVAAAIAMFGFLNASMAMATQRFMNYYEGKQDIACQRKIFNASMILHISICVIMGIALILAEPLMFDHLISIDAGRMDVARWVYRFAVGSTMITIAAVPFDAMINSHEDLMFFSVVGIVDAILKLMAALFIVGYSGDKLYCYGLLILVITFIVNISMYVFCKCRYKECVFNPTKYYDKDFLRKIASFGGWSFVGTSSAMMSQYGSKIVLNRFWGLRLNAAEGVTSQLTSVMMSLSKNLMKAVNPVIVKEEGRGEHNNMYRITFTVCKLMFVAFSVLALPLFFECDYLLTLWLKNVPPYCTEFVKLVIVLKVIEQVTEPINTSINAVGNIKTYNLVYAILQFSMIGLTVVFFSIGLSPSYLLISQIIIAILLSVYRIKLSATKNGMPLKGFVVDVLFRCLLTLIPVCFMSLVFVWLFSPCFLRMCIVSFVSIIALLITSYYILLKQPERTTINGLIKSFVINRVKRER